MATNKFLPFATGKESRTYLPETYESLTDRKNGVEQMDPNIVNTALRQSTSMAAALGEFIRNGGNDALDNGDIETLAKNIKEAVVAIGASVFFTQDEYDALEDPEGSGLYPSLAGKKVVVMSPNKLMQVEVQSDGDPLTVSIDENSLVHRPDLPDGTDLDTILPEGIYDLPSENTYPNAPVSDTGGAEGILTVLRSGGASKQRVDVLGPDVRTYERVYDGAWGEWKSTDRNYLSMPGNVESTSLLQNIVPDMVYTGGNTSDYISVGAAIATIPKDGFYLFTFLSWTTGYGVGLRIRRNNSPVFQEHLQPNMVNSISRWFTFAKGDAIVIDGLAYRDTVDRTLHVDGINLQYAPPKFSEIAGAPVTTDVGYSLAEQDTGTTWVDGKSIYKRTWQITTPAALGTTELTNLTNTGNIHTIVKHEGILVLHNGSTLTFGRVIYGGTNNEIVRILFNVNRDGPSMNLVARVTVPDTGDSNFIGAPCYITVWYTKL
jgi:hypothetical protein